MNPATDEDAAPADQHGLGADLAKIAEAAGRVILPFWRSGVDVATKSDSSPVTVADQRAETLILEHLARDFPGVPVISEEDASEFGVPEKIADRFFLVDPLDGTKGFIRGDVHFTVNIGLIERGRPVAGVVVAPATGEVWHTSAAGAMKRDGAGGARPIRVRPWPAGAAVALISHTMKPEALAELQALYGFATTLAMDSSVKLCRIAEGSADIYPRHGPTMEWDIAAAHAVLLAAGGRLAGVEGEPFTYGKAAAGFRNGGFVARGG
jgi:3'(2'), 5'-bisphosphate nucleotidase